MPNGFEQLRSWLPEFVVDRLNPHATVTTDVARELIGDALSTTLVVIGVLLASSLLGGLRNMLFSRTLFRKTGRFMAFIRKASALAVVAAPWWSVWQMVEGGGVSAGAEAIMVLAIIVWICACAVDHSGAWLDKDGAIIQLRSGFAIFAVRKVAIHLQQALLDPLVGAPLGSAVTSHAQRRRFRLAAVDVESWRLLRDQLGRNEAITFLQSALAPYMLRLDVEGLPGDG